MVKPEFSILITTKNRKSDLEFTLNKIHHLLLQKEVECIVFDDGSVDGTSRFIKEKYPNIILLRNQFSKGLIYCRNQMLKQTKAKYAISLDDDAHFITENPLPIIENFFAKNTKAAVLGFRLYWSKDPPESSDTTEVTTCVKSFVGCGHVWRMSAWRDIPDYPEWFVFYGEEDFASYQLFKKNWEIHYVPDVLVNHRVNLKSRKEQDDYSIRLRRSLRSGWYLYFLFYPKNQIAKRVCYTLWIQIKNKVLKGDKKAIIAILQALGDVIIHFPKLMKQSNRLSDTEITAYNVLQETKIYWQIEK